MLTSRALAPMLSTIMEKETKGAGPGRPRAATLRGHVTVAEAAEILAVSYSAVYTHVKAAIPFHQEPNGVIYVPRRELKNIKRAFRAPAEGDTRGVFVRVPAATITRWKRLISKSTPKGEKPKAVSRWLAELGDREVSAG